MSLTASRSRFILISVALASITLALYWPTWNYEWLGLDDNLYVTDNPWVFRGLHWDNIQWAFSGFRLGFWHPLTLLSHMAVCEVFGLAPGPAHFANVLLHAVNAVLLFVVLRELTGATWRSAFVAALFAWHPLHVESVAWISQRKDVLSTLFWFLAMGAYLRYARKPGGTRYALLVGVFGLGLMSKPMLVTLPFVLLLLDFWPLGRVVWRGTRVGMGRPGGAPVVLASLGQLILEKLPLLALAIVSSVMAFGAQTDYGAVASFELLPMGLRIENATVSYVAYLGKTFWPVGLSIHYPYPSALPAGKVALCAGLLLGITAWTIAFIRRRPWWTLGWFWYLGTLVPVIGIIQVNPSSMADRYTYVPLVGIFVAVTWGLWELAAGRPFAGWMLRGMAGLVLLACLWLSSVQMGHWKSDKIMCLRTLTIAGPVAWVENNLGNDLFREGRVSDAIERFRIALSLNPDYADAASNLANALLQQGNVEEAIQAAHRALEIRPEHADAHSNLGNAYLQDGRVDEAIVQYRQALRSKPEHVMALSGLGIAEVQMDRLDEAEAAFRKAVEIKPDFAGGHFNLGNLLLRTARWDEAISHYRTALEIQPGLQVVNAGLAKALDHAGRIGEAVAHYRKAAEFAPTDPEVALNLGVLLERQGDFSGAIAGYETALAIAPGSSAPHNNLAWILATCANPSLRDGARAVRLATEADRLAGGRDPNILDTLAAAFAATGDFPKAINTAERALSLAEIQGKTSLVEALRNELALYRTGKSLGGSPIPPKTLP